MENNLVSMNLDKSLVQEIVNKQVLAAVVAQMGNPAAMIEKVVQEVLKRKVDSEGRHRGESYYDKYDYFEMLSTKIIHEVVEKYMRQWFEENAEKVKRFVYSEMQKPGRAKSVAIAIADQTEEMMKKSYRMNFKVELSHAKKD